MPEIESIFLDQYMVAVRNPPKTLEGHINHENGVVNDYRGRAIFEFFQNAIDRAEHHIWIRLDTAAKQLIVANDGTPFSVNRVGKQRYSDFSALCSIDTSSKNQNESIGNKGVGFKSCWEYTQLVTVISNHVAEGVNQRWGFRLRNPMRVEYLQSLAHNNAFICDWLRAPEYREVIDSSREKGRIPSFYFPERLVGELPALPSGMEGAVTVISFDELTAESIEKLETKIREFARYPIFFVRQLDTLSKKDVTLTLQIDGESVARASTSHKADEWHIVSQDFDDVADSQALIDLQEASAKLNYRVEKPKVAIAFPLKETLLSSDFSEKTTTCAGRSMFYCYLATEQTAGFNVLVHGDFLLDVSRKRIDFATNDYNRQLLGHAADLLVKTLLEEPLLHELPHFAKFLTLSGADPFLREQVEKKLQPNLTEILRKVYTTDRKWNRTAYEQAFDAIESWELPCLAGQRRSTIQERNRHRIQSFCDSAVFIVPTSDSERPERLTSLPAIKNEKTYLNHLFYRASDADVLEVDLLKKISSLDISTFKELDRRVFNDLGIVRKYERLPLLTALANIVENDATLREVVLKFCCQLATQEPDRVPSRSDFFREGHTAKQFGRILMPCTDKGWHAALECYAGIESSIASSFDANTFFCVDQEEFQRLVGASDAKALLQAFGVWVDCIPLPRTLDALPWGENPPRTIDLKFRISQSLKEWPPLEDMAQVARSLRTQSWFGIGTKADKFCCPIEVFLFDSRDYRDIDCVYKEQELPGLAALYHHLEIRRIDDTSDAAKLLRQLHKMSHLSPHSDGHLDTYRAITRRLGQLWGQDYSIGIDIKSLPRLTVQFNEAQAYCGPEAVVWFVPAEQKRFKSHFATHRFIQFDDETSKTFVAACGLRILEPSYRIEYYDERNNIVQPISDHAFKTDFQSNKEFLASLFAIASSVLGSRFHKEEALARWQRLEVHKAYNAVLTIGADDYGSTRDRNTDVLYMPISEYQRSRQDDKTLIGELAHDLDAPLKCAAISKFGPALADAVFRDIRLSNQFADYLTKCYLGQKTPCDENDARARKDFLMNLSVQDTEIAAMQSYISERALTPSDWNLLLDALNKVDGITPVTQSNFRDLRQYKKLKMTVHDLFIALKLGERYRSTLEQLNPYWTNQKTLTDSMDDVLLTMDYYSQRNDGLPLPSTGDVVKQRFDELLHRFDFDVSLIYEKLKIALSDIDPYQLALFRIRKKHGLGDHSTQPPALVVRNTTPGNGKRELTLSKFDPKDEHDTQESQRIRGVGTEALLCYQGAYEFLQDHKDLMPFLLDKLKAAIDSESISPDNKYKSQYLELIKKQPPAEIEVDLLADLLHASKSIGDGLGYDIFYPEVLGAEVTILKVEVKSSKGGEGPIFLSENERERVLHFAKDENKKENWRLWLNEKHNDMTKPVIDAVTKHQSMFKDSKGVPLHAKTWYLTLGTSA